jgi:uroporphyrinogen decarboxylase
MVRKVQDMSEMTSHERFKRMYEHREADRVPVIDTPWGATVERWRREGMPEDVHWTDYFDVDRLPAYRPDTSPRYPVETVEETDEYVVRTTSYGVTVRNWKHAASTPEFLDHTVTDPDAWRAARERMTPSPDRIDWDRLKREYPRWREQGSWVGLGFWFGFDITHSWIVGTERVLMALVENPEWVMDMFGHELDMCIAHGEMLLEAGYEFDEISWPDDMGYKLNQFFSVPMYRELLKPFHQRAIEWAHSKGMKARLHSCGDVRPFVPELVEIGLDALNPLEVKAGMDPAAVKADYGDRLVLHGGINAVLWDQPEAIEEEIRRVVPKLKAGGGYIFSSDHSVPSSVSLEDFRGIVELAKEVGSY